MLLSHRQWDIHLSTVVGQSTVLLLWISEGGPFILCSTAEMTIPFCLWDGSSDQDSSLFVRWFLCTWILSICDMVPLGMIPFTGEIVPLNMNPLYLWDGSSGHESSLLVRWFLWTWFLSRCEMVPLNMNSLYLWDGSSAHDSSIVMTWFFSACEMVPLNMIPL